MTPTEMVTCCHTVATDLQHSFSQDIRYSSHSHVQKTKLVATHSFHSCTCVLSLTYLSFDPYKHMYKYVCSCCIPPLAVIMASCLTVGLCTCTRRTSLSGNCPFALRTGAAVSHLAVPLAAHSGVGHSGEPCC